MTACKYPQLENHRQVHRLLIRQLEDIKQQFQQGGVASDEVLYFLRNWLLEHIQSMDLDYASSCRGKEALIERALIEADEGPESGGWS